MKLFFMFKQTTYLLLVIVLVFSFFGCISNDDNSNANMQKNISSNQNISEIKLRFIKFHGNSQCTSCINLGKFANETLVKNYKTEIAAGTIEYRDINAEAEPNHSLVQKYKPNHASLYLETTKPGNVEFEELVQAWSYTSDKSAYEKYLVSVISKKLSG